MKVTGSNLIGLTVHLDGTITRQDERETHEQSFRTWWQTQGQAWWATEMRNND